MHLDFESCYRAVKSRDRRFDGVFYTAVRTTGIYCRPSCPARTPAFHNVTFHPTAAAAQAAGYRACKRCLPDATPGSPDWDVAADAAGRAMRLIADGVVDREGVDGLARRIGYTPAPPLAAPHPGARRRPARAGPGQARPDRAGAARDHRPRCGRRRVRGRLQQRPAVQRHGPRGLRRDADPAARPDAARATRAAPSSSGSPYARRSRVARCSTFLATRAVAGRRGGHGHDVRPHPPAARTASAPSSSSSTTTPRTGRRRSCPRPSGCPTCATSPPPSSAYAAWSTPTATRSRSATRSPATRCSARWCVGRPGLRVPGHVDGDELAVRAVLGQQVTVAAARTAAGRLTEQYGEPLLASPVDGLTHLFPTAATLAELDPESLPMPRARGRALIALCRAAGRRRAPPRPRRRPRRRTPSAAGAARHRALDRRLRRAARARPPRRLPAHRHRHPRRAAPARARPCGGRRPRRAMAALALLRPAPPLADAHLSTTKGH